MKDNAGVNGSIANEALKLQCLSFILIEKVVDMRFFSEDKVKEEANKLWSP